MGWVRCGLGTPSNILALPTPSEASGAIARFNTDLTENLLSAVAEFSASQAEGTPTPSTPIPIVGVDKVNVTRCGINLLPPSLPANCIAGTISAMGTAITTASNARIFAFAVPKNTDLFIQKLSSDTTSGSVALVDTDNIAVGTPYYEYRALTNVTTNTINTGNHGFMIVVSSSQENIEAYWTTRELMIHTGNARVNYVAPTSETTALINLGGTYYGGSVDAVTGKITLTHGIIDIGSLTWNYSTNYTYPLFFAELSGKAITDSIICSHFANKGLIINPNVFGSLGNYIIGSSSSMARIFIRDDDYTTASDFKTAMNGTMLAYELATPLVVYASNTAEIPTIVGDNQVFADTGDVAVKFFETVGHKI